MRALYALRDTSVAELRPLHAPRTNGAMKEKESASSLRAALADSRPQNMLQAKSNAKTVIMVSSRYTVPRIAKIAPSDTTARLIAKTGCRRRASQANTKMAQNRLFARPVRPAHTRYSVPHSVTSAQQAIAALERIRCLRSASQAPSQHKDPLLARLVLLLMLAIVELQR